MADQDHETSAAGGGARRRILILGGYGTFGGRLARLLADESRLTLLIAGRSLEKAQAFSASLPAGAERRAAVFDRSGDVSRQLGELEPDLVVDASGPFQNYGADPYALVRACISLKIDYLDLADGADFVAGVASQDAEAKAAGVYALSGVSSFPVLTAAVVRALAASMTRIDSISAGIAPSPHAGVGLNVIRAIASYAGQPIRLRRRGVETEAPGLIDSRRYTVRPPGMPPLDNIRFSLVDVPDLRLLPKLWPDARDVWIGAGPTPAILHRALSMLAHLVRWRVIPTLEPLAPLFHAAINLLRWGEHRGGMFVEVEGVSAEGKLTRRSWHFLAEGDDGPFIPSMAVEGIVRAELAGRRPASGARAAVNELELSDYDTLFARRAIRHAFRDEVDPRAPLYRRMLANAWDALPATIRAMHEFGADVAHGLAEIERGSSFMARVIASLFGFPEAGDDIPVTVRFARGSAVEVWTRTFADKSFQSRQSIGVGRHEGLLRERFGPFIFGLALIVDEGRLRLVPKKWSFLGIPLPRSLTPRGDAYEEERDGKFRFNVEIRLPLIGLIVAYRGWLEPERPTGA
ncbi:DUF4166 domain-containing protein [Terrarubrum flagellatum]|uniref:DUF4166 domain-containing protein n=1 Tax=Terrirubrum flagellatum TaxID=2895980 RepID=UPI003144F142